MSCFIFLFFLILLVLLIPATIVYFLYKFFANKGFKKPALVVVYGLIGFVLYNIYTAFYPTDEFFYADFKEVTLREVPKSAEIIKKTASYPDMQGNYSSISLMKLSKNDYQLLLRSILKDKKFTKGYIIYSDFFDEVMDGISEKNIGRQLMGTPQTPYGNYRYIGFLDDGQTIVVYLNTN